MYAASRRRTNHRCSKFAHVLFRLIIYQSTYSSTHRHTNSPVCCPNALPPAYSSTHPSVQPTLTLTRLLIHSLVHSAYSSTHPPTHPLTRPRRYLMPQCTRSSYSINQAPTLFTRYGELICKKFRFEQGSTRLSYSFCTSSRRSCAFHLPYIHKVICMF